MEGRRALFNLCSELGSREGKQGRSREGGCRGMSQPSPFVNRKVQETMRRQRRRNYLRTAWNVVDTFIHMAIPAIFTSSLAPTWATWLFKSEATNCFSINFQVFTNNNQH